MQCCNCDNLAVHMHHVVPRHKGGSDRPTNLVPLCAACHSLVHDVKLTSNREAISQAMQERIRKGLPVGQPPKYSPEQLFIGLFLMKVGFGLGVACEESEVSKSSLHRYAKERGFTKEQPRVDWEPVIRSVESGLSHSEAARLHNVSRSSLSRELRKRRLE